MAAPSISATRGRDFDFCGDRVAVVQFEGTVQLCFLRDGWPGGARAVMANFFAGSATPQQLRDLADHLDTLPLPQAVVPA